MEYLMTYGWAILIIAVILGVLFSLGVFNPVNYAPRVPAGSCHVFRPNGPGSPSDATLVGTCSGFLPQYTARFNGQSGSILIPYSSSMSLTSGATMAAWINFNPDNTTQKIVLQQGAATFASFGIAVVSGLRIEEFLTTTGNGYVGKFSSASDQAAANQWIFIAGTYDSTSGSLVIYIDGINACGGSSCATLSGQIVASTSPAHIGAYDGYHFNGSISNVQMYNTSLDANEIQYLYNEGIGGAPIYLSHLVGWWPLNGDTKDYSGNGNDGTPTNITFNGSWVSSYTNP